MMSNSCLRSASLSRGVCGKAIVSSSRARPRNSRPPDNESGRKERQTGARPIAAIRAMSTAFLGRIKPPAWFATWAQHGINCKFHARGCMKIDPSRREFVKAAAAAATATTLSMRHARAQPRADALGDWAYRSASELVAALAAKQISSVELVDRAIARIEAIDKRLNAVVVRDFDRARAGAKAADAALARGER